MSTVGVRENRILNGTELCVPTRLAVQDCVCVCGSEEVVCILCSAVSPASHTALCSLPFSTPHLQKINPVNVSFCLFSL